MVEPPAPPRAWRFWAYVASQVVSSTGDQVHLLAIGLLALHLTDSAFSFALLTTFSTIPNLGVALVAGTVADREPSRADDPRGWRTGADRREHRDACPDGRSAPTATKSKNKAFNLI